jgi:nucleoside-diphosphate-sugar epimerase
MTRVFITGSADGLGRAAAQTLLEHGHAIVVHARNPNRLSAVADLLDRGAAAVVGDLSDVEETRGVASQVNQLGRMDAVIHNAGVISGPDVLPVNVVAPYLLTALIHRPQRLVYLSKQHAPRRTTEPDRNRLERPARNGLVLGQQAVRHHARRYDRPDLGGRVQQRGGPGLGSHEDGRPGRA